MEHLLKTWPIFFKDGLLGKKNFEIRKNDRDYKVGDIIISSEFDPIFKNFTGMKYRRVITYILKSEDIPKNFGLQHGYCILELKEIEKDNKNGNIT